MKVRLTCRLCAALAFLTVNKEEKVWLIIMENVPQNEKLTLFFDYYAQQLIENRMFLPRSSSSSSCSMD
jgi:hypothetical protein